MNYEQAKAAIEEILNRAEMQTIDPDLARRILAIDLAGVVHDAYLQGRRDVLGEWHEHDKQRKISQS